MRTERIHLSSEVIDTIIGHMRKGVGLSAAIARAGINPSTPYRWLQLARRGDGTALEVEFLRQVEAERARVDGSARRGRSRSSRLDALECRVGDLEGRMVALDRLPGEEVP